MLTEYSRYRLSNLDRDTSGRTTLTMRKRIPFTQDADTIVYKAVAGDTLQILAARHYPPAMGGAQLWWAIAEFQPQPINDPTVSFDDGDIIFIPSAALVRDALTGMDEEDPQGIL